MRMLIIFNFFCLKASAAVPKGHDTERRTTDFTRARMGEIFVRLLTLFGANATLPTLRER